MLGDESLDDFIVNDDDDETTGESEDQDTNSFEAKPDDNVKMKRCDGIASGFYQSKNNIPGRAKR